MNFTKETFIKLIDEINLRPQEKLILKERINDVSLSKIAREIGKSDARVQQIEHKTCRKLMNWFYKKLIYPLYDKKT
jgi:DNA-directed RNA polymerase sigma subunit (sigma70/sigma32)